MLSAGRIRADDAIHALGGLKSYGVCTVELARYAKQRGLDVRIYSQTRAEDDITCCDASASLLQRLDGVLSMLTVDPATLTGKPSSTAFHNIVLTLYGRERSEYIDPADGLTHSVETSRILGAWQRAAPRASAHTVTVSELPI